MVPKLLSLCLFLAGYLYSNRSGDWLDITKHSETKKLSRNIYDIRKSLPLALKKYKNIFFPGGMFYFRPTKLSSNTSLKGMGQATILKAYSREVQRLGKKANRINSSFYAFSAKNISIEGFRFDYELHFVQPLFSSIKNEYYYQANSQFNFSQRPIMGLFFQDCQDVYLDNLHFYSIKNQAIALENCRNVKIKNSIFRRGSLGLAVRNSNKIFIKGNQFYLNTNAVTLSRNKKVFFYDNLITNNKYNIASFGSNEFKTSDLLGYKGAYTRLKNNRIMRTKEYNLYLEKVQNLFISTQNFYGGGALVFSSWHVNRNNFIFLKENVIEPPKRAKNREVFDNINVQQPLKFYLLGNRVAVSYLIGEVNDGQALPSWDTLQLISFRKDDFTKNFYKDDMVVRDNFYNLSDDDPKLRGSDLFREFKRLQ